MQVNIKDKDLEISNELNLSSLVENINADIYNWELTEIFEVTYSYDKWFNITLFKEFLWDEYEDIFNWKQSVDLKDKGIILKEIYKKTEKKLKQKEELVLWYIEKVKNLNTNNREDKIKKELLMWALGYWLKIIKLTLEWLVFEIEKAWLDINLSKEEKQNRINNIKKFEKEVFWWEIKDNSEEVVLAYEFLKDKYEEKKAKFSLEQQEEYERYLKESEKYLPEDYEYQQKEKKKNLLEENNFLNKKISRDSYVKILQRVFELLELDIEVKIENRASIYDWEYHLWIPSSEKYEYLTIRRILELISHEIEAHTVNLKNNQELIWYFRSAANLEKEEGLAIVMENLLNWKKIDEIWVPQHFPKVFMWEILSWNELKRFLELDNEINSDTWHAWRFFRLKRNYDLELPWVQHKDTSYWRWALKMVKLLKDIQDWKSDLDVRDLFLWKVGFKDLEKARELMQLRWLEYNDLHMPLFVWELVKYLFEVEDNNFNSRRRKNPNQKDFLDYLKDKYPFVDFDNIEIKTVSFIEKMKIWRILKEIKSVF